MSDTKHKKIKIEHLTNTNSTANEFVEEFGGKEDLFINTIRNNPKKINTSSHDNINCVNCINCINCTNCTDCENCIDCTGCVSCKNCLNCKNKKYAVNLIL